MSCAARQMLDEPVVTDDKAIASALAELDEKLARLARAMNCAQSALDAKSAGQVEQSPAAKRSFKTDQQDPVSCEAQVGTDDDSDDQTIPDQQAPVIEAPDKAAQSTTEDQACGDPPSDVSPAAIHADKDAGDAQELGEIAEPKGADNDEDKALLATLDAQVIYRIRMIRRMNSSDSKKSVRELLNEYDLSGSVEQLKKESTKIKSWWKR